MSSSSSSSSSSDDDNDENRLGTDDAQTLASQKALIYKHPLFPVLVYVLERCEQATLNPSLLLTNNDETYIPTSFEHNLKIFLAKNNDILSCGNRETNNLSSSIDDFYVDAMQVLRIHLLELDKVNDLCRDFCQRYIACLKVKLNTQNMFTDDEDEEEEDDDGESNDFEMVADENDDDDEFTSSDEEDSMFSHHTRENSSEQHFGKQSVLNHNSTSLTHPCATQFDGQTPLSQIISTGRSHIIDMSSSLLFDSVSSTKRRKQSSITPILVSSSSKRGVLPKSATSIMRSWLFQHIVHPYPTEDEKRAISQKTNLSLLQVNNWFINARRRILQPMLEASNPDLAANKKKKRHDTSTTIRTTTSDENSHRQNTNTSRYWPSNLAQFDVTTMGHRKK